MPTGFPVPAVPGSNPLTAAKIELGRHLFYDTRLSVNRKQSCATCHRQDLAFSDGRPRAIGTTGERHPRNSMSLTNVAYNASYTWADPNVATLEAQALVPMFNENPIELGVTGHEEEILGRLDDDQRYRRMFRSAFPAEEGPITIDMISKALASFERTLISGNSAFDRYSRGEEAATLGPGARRGMELFFSDQSSCFRCHSGFNFSGPVQYHDFEPPELAFHNTGLIPGKAERARRDPEARNTGVFGHTGKKRDRGRFRAPTLRNIELTAPYMHDGRFETLDDVIDHYNRGGSYATRYRSRLVRPLGLTGRQKRDLVAFLGSLTDRAFVADDRFSNPWDEAAWKKGEEEGEKKGGQVQIRGD
ncbi:MAG: MbnH family di-heme enzyme [Thermoanaerobaculia bacterium]